jgi:penicillin-binding protein 1A
MTLTEALAQSINTVAVKVSEAVGRDNVRKVATDFGIETDLADGPALALGTSETTPAADDRGLCRHPQWRLSVRPYGLIGLRLQGESEPLMTKAGGMGERVISEDAARQLTYMMTR